MGEWEYESSRIVVERYSRKLLNALKCDVLIAGAGPAGMVAAYYLAQADLRVTMVERGLAPGGGAWGGGMGRNEVVVHEEARAVLDELGIAAEPESKGLFGLDSMYLGSSLCCRALQEGATILNLVAIEDVMMEDGRLTGLAVNLSGMDVAEQRTDPLVMSARAVIDGTGREAAVVRLVQAHGGKLETETGEVMGLGPMQARAAEQFVVEHTGLVFPGLYVAGTAAAAVHGGPRMGPIFGGAVLSGKKAAELVQKELKTKGRAR
ncbi:MAG TPA: sulfide-dependent adenosine diphosphate thiazole synthase [bacterium]|nr:sulfide-dependent adenosine diphosphate thiazole synthase [bacterium]